MMVTKLLWMSQTQNGLGAGSALMFPRSDSVGAWRELAHLPWPSQVYLFIYFLQVVLEKEKVKWSAMKADFSVPVLCFLRCRGEFPSRQASTRREQRLLQLHRNHFCRAAQLGRMLLNTAHVCMLTDLAGRNLLEILEQEIRGDLMGRMKRLVAKSFKTLSSL